MGDVEIAEEVCCRQDPSLPCSPTFKELADLFMEKQGLQMPSSPNEAKSLYRELLSCIKDVEDSL